MFFFSDRRNTAQPHTKNSEETNDQSPFPLMPLIILYVEETPTFDAINSAKY